MSLISVEGTRRIPQGGMEPPDMNETVKAPTQNKF
jgi:hypothetical protein